MNIREFKKGQSVVRTEPAKSLGNSIHFLTGELISLGGDRSYLGEELIFVGIANGKAYFKPISKFHTMIFGDELLGLPLDIWSDGWELYVNPNTLLESEETIINLSKDNLETELESALKNEDYEKAEKIRKLIENLDN